MKAAPCASHRKEGGGDTWHTGVLALEGLLVSAQDPARGPLLGRSILCWSAMLSVGPWASCFICKIKGLGEGSCRFLLCQQLVSLLLPSLLTSIPWATRPPASSCVVLGNLWKMGVLAS